MWRGKWVLLGLVFVAAAVCFPSRSEAQLSSPITSPQGQTVSQSNNGGVALYVIHVQQLPGTTVNWSVSSNGTILGARCRKFGKEGVYYIGVRWNGALGPAWVKATMNATGQSTSVRTYNLVVVP